MKTLGIILLISLGIAGMAVAAVLAAFTWAIHKENLREQEQIRQQMADDRFTAAYWDEHDVSGLIEED